MSRQAKLSKPALERAALYAQMPPWFDRDSTCTTDENNVYLNFVKPCSCGLTQQSIWVGKAQGAELARKLAAAVVKKHGGCHETTPSADPETLQQHIRDLENQLMRQKHKIADFEAGMGWMVLHQEKAIKCQAVSGRSRGGIAQ